MVRVKVCGITNPEDAGLAVKLGVHALGFIFASSPRQISPERAKEIISGLPPFVQIVGVFVNEDTFRIKEIARYCGLHLLQLHGDESPELCRKLFPKTIKAFRLKDEESLEKIGSYQGSTRAILLDTYVKGKKGGTGRSFDWGLAIKAGEFNMPVILSGGLNPENISEAVSMVRPFAVDINSGIEESPGKKDPDLMKELMKKIWESGRILYLP